jgi:nitroreductase
MQVAAATLCSNPATAAKRPLPWPYEISFLEALHQMNTPRFFAAALLVCAGLSAQDLNLPSPQKTGGMPLMDALAKRATARAFDSRDLSSQQLSDLLWAAWGINRPDGRRTAPSAHNNQEIDVYALLKTGVFVYVAKGHQLSRISSEDCRALGGTQSFVRDAPVTLVLVADLAKAGGGGKDWALIDTGFISQNIYLYCASQGLATGARGSVDKAALGPRLKLRPDQVIVLAQSVGYPKP